MSWSVSGTVEGVAGEAGYEDTFSGPPQADEQMAQFDFLRDVIWDAFENNLLDGKYSASLSGHDDPSNENNRKSFSLSLSAVS